MTDGEPEITIAEGFAILHSNPEDILAKRRDFPATAAIVEELMPYYNHALKAIVPTVSNGSNATKFAAAAQGIDYSHLPAGLAKEVRGHLEVLQSSGFQLEVAGDAKRANMIRDVAQNLYTMLKTIQQMGTHEATVTPPPQNKARKLTMQKIGCALSSLDPIRFVFLARGR